MQGKNVLSIPSNVGILVKSVFIKYLLYNSVLDVRSSPGARFISRRIGGLSKRCAIVDVAVVSLASKESLGTAADILPRACYMVVL